MKNIFLTAMISVMSISMVAQNCYTVSKVDNLTENPDLSSKKFTFGVKQIAEELLGENGKQITVNIISIEAPSIGINIGPFMIKKKITEVKTVIIIDEKEYEGFGVAKLSVKAGFAELRDENLPFEKSVFASAIKKSIQNGVEKI